MTGASGRLGRRIIQALLIKGIPAADIGTSEHHPAAAQGLADQGGRVRAAESHRLTEEYIKDSGIEYTILLPES